jgi:small-conductance mechanosensitive channel
MIRFLSCLFLFFFIYPGVTTAQETNDVDPDVTTIQPTIAPVRIDGKVLYYIGGISSYPADQRAATISKRIIKVAGNKSIPIDSVTITRNDDHLKIYAGKEFIMNLYENDARTEGVTLKLLSEIIITKIKDSIVLYRHNRTHEVLLKKAFFAIIASGLFAICLVMLSWLTRSINRYMTRRLKSGMEIIEFKSQRLISSVQLWKIVNILFKVIKWIFTVLIILIFIGYILRLFPWTNSFAVSAFRVFIKPVADIGKAILNYLPSLVFLILITLITRYLLKLLKIFFSGIGNGAIVIRNFYPEWAIPTFKILRMGIIALALILAFPYLPGSGSPAFKGISVFIGVLLSLGSSSFISNIIAGYTMTYRRAFKNGDLIEVDKHIGYVQEQKLLVTRIRSYKNEEIIVPNSILLNSHITNFNARIDENGLILHTSVGIGYETPWRQVDAMLKVAALRTEGVLSEPEPFVLKTSLSDFAVNYEINVYVRDVRNMLEHYSTLHQNILDVFNENNVQIMTPAYMSDPQSPKVVPKDQWVLPLTKES